MQQHLSLSDAAIEPSRAGLWRWGNVSSASVWWVGARACARVCVRVPPRVTHGTALSRCRACATPSPHAGTLAQPPSHSNTYHTGVTLH
jgi:hypothetical protein